MPTFSLDLSSATQPFPHYWEECVGSCHASLALREDYRQQLKRCHDELGFKRVRFHGLLNDDMSIFSMQEGKSNYSFYNVDSIFDFLLKIGMQPFIELSFMPKDLASGTRTIFHYPSNVTAPRSYDEWSELIEALLRHLVERYGLNEIRSWYFEVWNEPNLNDPDGALFWLGNQKEYFSLYKHAVQAIKSVDPLIKVGGPVTARNAWISDMLAYCHQNQISLDFISTHHYPTDAALSFSDMEDAMASTERGVLRKMAALARKEAKGYPLYYTEWSNSPSSRDSYHDDPYAAAFIVKTIVDLQGIVDIYSFWAFSDIFEELPMPSLPFYGGFGLLNLYGVPKPSYRAFELLHRLGKVRIPLNADPHPTVEAVATINGNKLMVLVYNHNIPRAPIMREQVIVKVMGKEIIQGHGEGIDETHANPKRAWLAMGCPKYPDKDQIKVIL